MDSKCPEVVQAGVWDINILEVVLQVLQTVSLDPLDGSRGPFGNYMGPLSGLRVHLGRYMGPFEGDSRGPTGGSMGPLDDSMGPLGVCCCLAVSSYAIIYTTYLFVYHAYYL